MTALDTQRSRVYEFERMVARMERRDLYSPTWETLDHVIQWAAPVWRAERGRYGRPGARMPAIERPARGQRRALAYLGQRRITLPRWARSPWVTLHEMAHLLVQANEPPHGPRFVGVLIGLACRHLDYDAHELMRVADQAGVNYHVRSIGSVPVRGIQWRAEKALGLEGPMIPVDLACWLSLGTYHDPVTWRQVQGAMLGAIAEGRVRLFRGKFRLLAPASDPLNPPSSSEVPRRQIGSSCPPPRGAELGSIGRVTSVQPVQQLAATVARTPQRWTMARAGTSLPLQACRRPDSAWVAG